MSQTQPTARLSLSLWYAKPDENPARLDLEGPLSMSSRGRLSPLPAGSEISGLPTDALLLIPLNSRAETICAALIPDHFPADVHANGSRCGAGLVLLRSRDELTVAGHRLWIAAPEVVSRSNYSPAEHGPNVFCCRSKRRLAEGEEFVTCPRCTSIFRSAAWDLPEPLPCHVCQFDPRVRPWEPPPIEKRLSLVDLFHRLETRKRSGTPSGTPLRRGS